MFKRKAFALDISDYSIYALELKGKKEKMYIHSFSRGILPEGIVEDGEIKDKEKLVKAIKALIDKAGPKKIRTNNVICCLPESKIFTYIFSFPKELNKNQVREALTYEAKEIIPLEPEEIYSDIQIISKNKETQDVFFAAAPRKLVDNYMEVLKKCGLDPIVLDMESASLARSLVKKVKKDTGTIILDIGGRTTNISIYDKSGIRLNFSLNVAGKKITKAIAKKMNIEIEEAEKLKEKNGLDPSKKEGEIFLIIQSILQPIIAEIEKSVHYYQNTSGRNIDEIILCGGSAKMPKLCEYLSDNIENKVKLKVNIGDPLVKMDKESLPKGQGFKTQAIDYATVIGLAMRSLYKKDYGVNFIPQLSLFKRLRNKFKKAKVTSKVLPAPTRPDKQAGEKGDGKKSTVDKESRGEEETKKKRPLNYKVIGIVILLLIIISAGSVFVINKLFESSKPRISQVLLEPKELSLDFQVGIEEKDLPDYIKGEKITKSYNWSKSYVPSSVEVIEDKAKGMITIINKSSLDQPLVATTRFLSEDGVLFRLKERVVVPGQGQIEAEVYADKEGESGDIGPSLFTIPGLSSSAQKLIYGESVIAMKGGVKRLGILTEEDIESAQEKANEEAIEEIKDSFLQDISEEYGQNYVFLDDLIDINILSNEISAEAGGEVEEFTVDKKFEVNILIFLVDEIQNFIKNNISLENYNNYELIIQNYEVKNFSIKDFSAKLSVDALINPLSAVDK